MGPPWEETRILNACIARKHSVYYDISSYPLHITSMLMQTKFAGCVVIFCFLLAACEDPFTDSGDSDGEKDCLTTAGDVLLPMAEGNYWTSEQLNFCDGMPEDRRDTGKIVIEELRTIQFEGADYQVGVRNLYFPVDSRSDINLLFRNGADGLYFMGGLAAMIPSRPTCSI